MSYSLDFRRQVFKVKQEEHLTFQELSKGFLFQYEHFLGGKIVLIQKQNAINPRQKLIWFL